MGRIRVIEMTGYYCLTVVTYEDMHRHTVLQDVAEKHYLTI